MITSLDLYATPHARKSQLLSFYKGHHVTELPTPSFILNKKIVEANCIKMIQRTKDLGVEFRAHVKTHKSYQGLKYQMGYDLAEAEADQTSAAPNTKKNDRIIVSTMNEAWQILDEQETNGETIVNDILYGLPGITTQYLEQMYEISKKVANVRLMVDHVQHLDNIKQFNLERGINKKWSIFIKIDAGTNRAGIEIDDPSRLTEFLAKLLSDEYSEFVELYGFYCHMGHSYAADTIGKAEKALIEEISYVSKATDILKGFDPNYLSHHKVVASIGATPTIHSFDNYLYKNESPDLDSQLRELITAIKSQNIELEIHAGNYPICDLQQLATGCINEENIACYVLSQVISQYPGRRNTVGEMLMSTGVISLTKEVSSVFKGYGAIRFFQGHDYGDWYVDRLSQEHGILAPTGDPTQKQQDQKLIPIGEKIKVIPQHACITINGFSHLFLVDDNDIVVDVWMPWRGY